MLKMCISVKAQTWGVINKEEKPCKGDLINAPLQGATKDYNLPQACAWGYLLKCLYKALLKTEN
jgi:hypothetical protein